MFCQFGFIVKLVLFGNSGRDAWVAFALQIPAQPAFSRPVQCRCRCTSNFAASLIPLELTRATSRIRVPQLRISPLRYKCIIEDLIDLRRARERLRPVSLTLRITQSDNSYCLTLDKVQVTTSPIASSAPVPSSASLALLCTPG